LPLTVTAIKPLPRSSSICSALYVMLMLHSSRHYECCYNANKFNPGRTRLSSPSFVHSRVGSWLPALQPLPLQENNKSNMMPHRQILPLIHQF
jgi:hypothetical protein